MDKKGWGRGEHMRLAHTDSRVWPFTTVTRSGIIG
jgi:hypothetical protein